MTVPPDLAICQQVVGGRDGVDDLRLARAAGFSRISLHMSRLTGQPNEKWRALLTELDLTASGYMSIRDILAGAPDAEERIATAATLGARYVVVITGPLGDRRREEADEMCADWFARMQPIASAVGIRLALEPLHPLRSSMCYIHRLRDGQELLRDAPGAGLVVDTAHLWWDEDLIEDFAAAIDDVVTVQLADVDPVELASGGYQRCPFGSGLVPNMSLIRAFSKHGYSGAFEHETTVPVGPDRSEQLAQSRRQLLEFW